MANELQRIDSKTIGSELQKYKSQMEAALPRHMTADRMARIALTALRVNPKLMNCTRESFFGSLMAASQLGFEPGINGQCYLIPYGTTCTLVPGWRGYMDLLNRTGRAAARTDAVFDGDEFDYEMGTDIKIHHKRGKWGGDPDAITYVYAVGKIKGMEEFPIIDVWDIDKVKWHRDKQNKVGDKHYSYAHFEMYARKLPLLQILKYLPSSIELANASALDITATEGRQSLTIDMALKGELENGGGTDVPVATDPIEHELDALFVQGGQNPSQQKMLRESYHGRTKELVDYLKGRVYQYPVAIQPTGSHSTVVTMGHSQSESESKANTPMAYQEGADMKRGRGRPRKVVEEPTTGQPSLIPAAIPVIEPSQDDDGTDGWEQGGVEYPENPNLPDTAASAFDLE